MDGALEDALLDYEDDGELLEDSAPLPSDVLIASSPDGRADSMEEGELADDSDCVPQLPVVAADPLEQRAARFGIRSDDLQRRPVRLVEEAARHPRPELAATRRRVHASLGLVEPDGGGPLYWRPEALHMRGVAQLSSDDVLEYFQQLRPAHVEWVGDDACNVIWMDDETPVWALHALSSPITDGTTGAGQDPDALLVGLQDMDSSVPTADSDMNSVDEAEEAVEACGVTLPPGRWRMGVPHPAAKTLLLRFATRGDKKLPGAEKCGALYKLYGNPQLKGVSGIMTERRRRQLHLTTATETPSGPTNPWADIAATWATAEATRRPARDHDHDAELALLAGGGAPADLRLRLVEQPGRRPTAPVPRKHQHSGSESDDDHRWRRRLKRPRMRMHADEERVDKTSTFAAPERDLRLRLTVRNDVETRLPCAEELPASPFPADTGSADDPQLLNTKPLNIKITRDFSDGEEQDELESDSECSSSGSDSSSSAPQQDDSDSGDDDADGGSQLSSTSSSRSATPTTVEPVDEDALLDRRTDRNSSSDLRAILNRKRAQRPPLQAQLNIDQ